MSGREKELFKRVGFFVSGAVVASIVVLHYFPSTYQGKTAQEWNSEYISVNSEYSTAGDNYLSLLNTIKNLTTCLLQNRSYYDYYNGLQFYVYDVKDVHSCIMQYHDPRAGDYYDSLNDGL